MVRYCFAWVVLCGILSFLFLVRSAQVVWWTFTRQDVPDLYESLRKEYWEFWEAFLFAAPADHPAVVRIPLGLARSR